MAENEVTRRLAAIVAIDVADGGIELGQSNLEAVDHTVYLV